MIGWEFFRGIFRVEGFPLQRPVWSVIYCNGLLYVFTTGNIFNFLINFTFWTATYLSKHDIGYLCRKVPLNPIQSINQSIYPSIHLSIEPHCVNIYWIHIAASVERRPCNMLTPCVAFRIYAVVYHHTVQWSWGHDSKTACTGFGSKHMRCRVRP